VEGTYVRTSAPRKIDGKLVFDVPDVGRVEIEAPGP